jgi:molybdopterin molybdotransferase
MAAEIKSDQRITRLTPLADVLAHIQTHVKPVAPKRCDISAALGLTLAEDIHVTSPIPAHAVALRDGYAVESETTRDASSYAPIPLPEPAFVNAGQPLPSGADSILPQDAVISHGKAFAIQSPVIIGDGVLPKGLDADPATVLLRAGQTLRNIDIAVLLAAKVASADVRAPRIAIQRAGRADDKILDAALTWMAHAITVAGGHVVSDADNLGAALVNNDADAAIMIGGTGTGRQDKAVTTLAAMGSVTFHGIAIAPGETAGVGSINSKPVLLIPGRLDAALACWLFLGEKMLGCLSGRTTEQAERAVRLTRKVTSSLGMTELIPVSCKGGDAEPLASNYLSLQVLARADGWISVPAQSEGYAAGTIVTVRPLP